MLPPKPPPLVARLDRYAHASCADEQPLRTLDPTFSGWYPTTAACARLEDCCVQSCLAPEGCSAVTYNYSSFRCALHSSCTVLAHTESSVVIHRTWHWPPRVSWQAATAVVVAHYKQRLGWLKKLRVPHDLVVYKKSDHGAGNGAEAERQRQRVLAIRPLSYFCTLFNAGHNGGGREPQAYFAFLSTFFDNLPRKVIFTHDDCGACFFLHWTAQETFDVNMTGSAAEIATRPSRESCLCHEVQEDFFIPRRYGQYPLLMTLRDGIFVSQRPVSANISWPKNGIFAVDRASASACALLSAYLKRN